MSRGLATAFQGDDHFSGLVSGIAESDAKRVLDPKTTVQDLIKIIESAENAQNSNKEHTSEVSNLLVELRRQDPNKTVQQLAADPEQVPKQIQTFISSMAMRSAKDIIQGGGIDAAALQAFAEIQFAPEKSTEAPEALEALLSKSKPKPTGDTIKNICANIYDRSYFIDLQEDIKAHLLKEKTKPVTLTHTGLLSLFNDFSSLASKNEQEGYTAFKAIGKKNQDDDVLEVTTHSGDTATITKKADRVEISGSRDAVLASVVQLHLLELASKGDIKLNAEGGIAEVINKDARLSIDPSKIQVIGADKNELLGELDQKLQAAFKERSIYTPMVLPAQEAVTAAIPARNSRAPFARSVSPPTNEELKKASEHIVQPSLESTTQELRS